VQSVARGKAEPVVSLCGASPYVCTPSSANIVVHWDVPHRFASRSRGKFWQTPIPPSSPRFLEGERARSKAMVGFVLGGHLLKQRQILLTYLSDRSLGPTYVEYIFRL
jgi:hypothetical protein